MEKTKNNQEIFQWFLKYSLFPIVLDGLFTIKNVSMLKPSALPAIFHKLQQRYINGAQNVSAAANTKAKPQRYIFFPVICLYL